MEERMNLVKKLNRIFFYVSLGFSLALAVLLVCFNFAGVFTIQTLPGTKYENPFTYPGWQCIYYGVGEMIIQNYTEFTFNIYNSLGLFVPLIGLIVTSIILMKNFNRKGTNKKKAIVEIIMAVLAIFGGIMLFNCDKFAIQNASQVHDSYQNYYKEYLLPALNGEVMFHKTFYPTLILIVSIMTAAVKACDAAILIYQKKLGRQISLSRKKEQTK